MKLIFTIPLFFSVYYVLKGRQDLAFLNVYLPCAFLVPPYYAVRIPHLPPESAASWALCPLGISLLFFAPSWNDRRPYEMPNFRLMDLWVILFTLSFGASEVLRESIPKDGLALFASWIIQVFFAYVVGRKIIEPTLRLATIKRIVILFMCLTPGIIYEYGTHKNPWGNLGLRLGAESTTFEQIRDGSARVQASFGNTILAGILFFVVFLLNCWLAKIYGRKNAAIGNLFSKVERFHVPAVLFILFLLLTRSRAPLISAVVGYSILQIPRFRRMKLAALVLIVAMGIATIIAYNYLNAYTSATYTSSTSEQQSSAMYRRDLLRNYQPVVERGGWLGWGALSHPHVAGQDSIDNNYLLIQLSQGKLGLYLFLLIAATSLVTNAYCAFTFESNESQYLAFVLLGSQIGLFLSLYTVYMGDSVAPVCFLLLGWSQSLRDKEGTPPDFQFKRVFG